MSRAELTGYEPVLCTTDEKSDDALAAHVAEAGFRVIRGDSTNKIARWFTAAQKLDREVIHSLDADDPYFDFDEVRDSISNLRRMDLQLVHTSLQSDRGMASVGTTFDRRYLRELDKRARMLVHSDLDVIPWSRLITEQDRVHRMPDRSLGLLDRDARLTLDYPEDYQLLVAIANHLDFTASRFDVEQLLSNHPDWITINIHRSEDFAQRQLKQRQTFDQEF